MTVADQGGKGGQRCRLDEVVFVHLRLFDLDEVFVFGFWKFSILITHDDDMDINQPGLAPAMKCG